MEQLRKSYLRKSREARRQLTAPVVVEQVFTRFNLTAANTCSGNICNTYLN